MAARLSRARPSQSGDMQHMQWRRRQQGAQQGAQQAAAAAGAAGGAAGSRPRAHLARLKKVPLPGRRLAGQHHSGGSPPLHPPLGVDACGRQACSALLSAPPAAAPGRQPAKTQRSRWLPCTCAARQGAQRGGRGGICQGLCCSPDACSASAPPALARSPSPSGCCCCSSAARLSEAGSESARGTSAGGSAAGGGGHAVGDAA
jgi:hypothetical protein